MLTDIAAGYKTKPSPLTGRHLASEFFPGPHAFCKKAVERVRSEKNILNSSVEWSGWSGFF